MRQVGYRMDYLWFLGMGLKDPVPDPSILSKARGRWGEAVFERLFVRTVSQCVEAGLVGGGKVHFDASFVDADAGRDSIVKGPPQMVARLKALYAEQAKKLESLRGRRRARGPRAPGAAEAGAAEAGAGEADPAGHQTIQPEHIQQVPPPAPGADEAVEAVVVGEGSEAAEEAADQADDSDAKVNDTLVSSTDPDAAVARHKGASKGGPRLRYMSHRAVDDREGVITAVATTPGDVDEGKLLPALVNQHEHNTGLEVEVGVGDASGGAKLIRFSRFEKRRRLRAGCAFSAGPVKAA